MADSEDERDIVVARVQRDRQRPGADVRGGIGVVGGVAIDGHTVRKRDGSATTEGDDEEAEVVAGVRVGDEVERIVGELHRAPRLDREIHQGHVLGVVDEAVDIERGAAAVAGAIVWPAATGVPAGGRDRKPGHNDLGGVLEGTAGVLEIVVEDGGDGCCRARAEQRHEREAGDRAQPDARTQARTSPFREIRSGRTVMCGEPGLVWEAGGHCATFPSKGGAGMGVCGPRSRRNGETSACNS